MRVKRVQDLISSLTHVVLSDKIALVICHFQIKASMLSLPLTQLSIYIGLFPALKDSGSVASPRVRQYLIREGLFSKIIISE